MNNLEICRSFGNCNINKKFIVEGRSIIKFIIELKSNKLIVLIEYSGDVLFKFISIRIDEYKKIDKPILDVYWKKRILDNFNHKVIDFSVSLFFNKNSNNFILKVKEDNKGFEYSFVLNESSNIYSIDYKLENFYIK